MGVGLKPGADSSVPSKSADQEDGVGEVALRVDEAPRGSLGYEADVLGGEVGVDGACHSLAPEEVVQRPALGFPAVLLVHPLEDRLEDGDDDGVPSLFV